MIDRSRAAALGAALAFSLAGLAALPALADDQTPNDAAAGVARLSDMQGSVQVQRGDSGQTTAAALNAPLSVGDYLTTGDGARAEVEFDHATLVRLAPQTQIRFVKLDDGQHELQLAQGTVELRVFHGLDSHPLVDTPAATVIPDDNGRYRVTVTSDGNSEVTARSGRADVQIGSDNQTRTIEPGSTLLIAGDTNNPQVSQIDTVADTNFDQWADARDGRWNDVSNWAYTDNGMVGAEDLSQYGQWSDNSQYGEVWQPTDEPADWSPYTDGSFAYEPYYGWTWVGDEPWGYAPYHYGRWFYSDAWYWAPGPIAPYAYAPAVVGFFGWGGGGLFDGGFANIGWTPLAPSEPFTPWWGGGTTVVINNYYGGNGGFPWRNAVAPGGAVGVAGTSFGTGNFHHVVPIGVGLQHLHPIAGSAPVAPTLASLTPGHAALDNIHPLSPHFSRFAPMRTPISFAQERAGTLSAVHAYAAQAQRAQTEPAGLQSQGGAWSRFGSSARYQPSTQSAPTPAERSNLPSYAVRGSDENPATNSPAMHGYAPASTENRTSGEASYAVPRSAQARPAQPSYAQPNYSAPQQQRYSAPQQQRYSAPQQQRYSAPQQQRYSAPQQQRYSAPQQHYSAPRPAPQGGSDHDDHH